MYVTSGSLMELMISESMPYIPFVSCSMLLPVRRISTLFLNVPAPNCLVSSTAYGVSVAGSIPKFFAMTTHPSLL